MPTSASNIKYQSFKHISIRVPWHDNKWNGSICNKPKENASCLALERILINKNDKEEDEFSGCSIKDLHPDQWPACIDERGSFMAPFEIIRDVIHPYTNNEYYNHFISTPFRHPVYSAASIPFRWMSWEYAEDIAEKYGLDVIRSREPTTPYFLKNNKWVQNHQNQKSLLDAFFGMIKPEHSLCFFYATQTPLVEDERRILIGVGRVKHVGSLIEYNYSSKKERHAYIWDHSIQHSIRSDFSDGFLLPYFEILKLANEDSSINPSDYVAFAPEDRRSEFSYVSEHVTNDAAISSLLACKNAIEKSKKIVDGPWEDVLSWIDTRLSELWKLRGTYPGLGVALSAFGVKHGSFFAYELESKMGENEDPWILVDTIFKDPVKMFEPFSLMVTDELQKKWKYIKSQNKKRLALLKLISRLELTKEQAQRFYVNEEREKANIHIADEDILNNPYLIYETDRDSLDPISVWTVDKGIFPPHSIREKFPLPHPSRVTDTDKRRIRALIINSLEQAASNGHTILGRDSIVMSIRNLAIYPSCPIDGDLLDVLDLSPEIITQKLKNESPAYQLKRLGDTRRIIKNVIEKRIKGKKHNIDVDWRTRIDNIFEMNEDEYEDKARNEKAQALTELAKSRISVLIGAAGTGKTTLLSILCQEDIIANNGVLLLAPTGKARVRLQKATKHSASTLAQFLFSNDRYDPFTGKYDLSSKKKVYSAKTIIIDEASMLTEEQLATLFDTLKGVDRYILVGDPCQLPPIGPGRPFVDIVNFLKPPDVETMPTKVSRGYAELTINRRQIGEQREDLELAEWFSGRPLGPGDDEVFNNILSDDVCRHVHMEQWEDFEDLRNKVLITLVKELGLEGTDDQKGFDTSLGGSCKYNYVYFNLGAGQSADAWQLISPVRGMPHGVRDINRLIQNTFRNSTKKLASDFSYKPKIPKPLGPEGIVYGDKVINVINNCRDSYPKEKSMNYVANGEIGIAVSPFISKNQYNTKDYKKLKRKIKWLNIEYSSQPEFTYGYSKKDFTEEMNPILELAYAITVHKSQGSDFELSILILPKNCRLLSRELLYTALTRQRERVIVLHQGQFSDFLQYNSDDNSETLQRMTNLFDAPSPISVNEKFLEENLINKSNDGKLMRSKSEVIIANELIFKGIEFEYERPLIGKDGQKRYPDFTIEDDDTGITYYWEHLGMLNNKKYKERWERKLIWYLQQDILPFEEGGGDTGTLIITSDTPKGGLDSKQITELIELIWGV